MTDSNIKIIKFVFDLAFIAVLIAYYVAICFFSIDAFSKPYIYTNIKNLPFNKTALVLGTSQYLRGGSSNLYFQYRIDAATELYRAGKVKFIIVSGDNSVAYYNEPRAMKNALVAEGIPASRIYQDHAGFRTLDAVVRAKKIFGQNSLTIISQDFHNRRAVYLARHEGIKAVGFDAKDVPYYFDFATKAREYLARVRAILDILFSSEPKFLGKKIIIENKTLEQRLDEWEKEWRAGVSEKHAEIIDSGIDEIKARKISEKALKAGDTIPDFIISINKDSLVSIYDILKKKNLILTWYRGGWSQYCRIMLRTYQEFIPEFEKYNALLIAISPENFDSSASTKTTNYLDYPVVSDPGNSIAGKFGLTYKLPYKIKRQYDEVFSLKNYYLDNSGILPITACYIIDSAGVIRYSHLDEDYRKRAEPAEIIKNLKDLRTSY